MAAWVICIGILYISLPVTPAQESSCHDIDTTACKRMVAQSPDLCSDEYLAKKACPKFCQLCALECYSCNATVLDYNECNTTVKCGKDEMCMRKELKSSIDGHHEYEMTCELKEVCDGGEGLSIPFGKRHVETRDISITCCDNDRCNYPKSSTITTTTAPATATTSNVIATTTSNASFVCPKDHIYDGSFEQNGKCWNAYLSGFTAHFGSAQDGYLYISVTDGGAQFAFDFQHMSQPVYGLTLSGYSRIEHITTASSNPNDYSVFCDITHTDKSQSNEKTADFDPNYVTNVWQYKELRFSSQTPIESAWCYAMFRRAKGIVDFDNFHLSTSSTASSVDPKQSSHCATSLEDGSFERVNVWHNYEAGFTIVSGSDAQDGNHYITVEGGGVHQVIDFSRSPVNQFSIGGYSRPHRGARRGNDVDDYSIDCRLTHTNGQETRGYYAAYDVNAAANQWHYQELHVQSTNGPIASAECYIMFRDGTGKVDFDNFRLSDC